MFNRVVVDKKKSEVCVEEFVNGGKEFHIYIWRKTEVTDDSYIIHGTMKDGNKVPFKLILPKSKTNYMKIETV